MFYHYAKIQSLKCLYHIKCTIERNSQLTRKLAIHKAWDVWESCVNNSKVFRVFWLRERWVTTNHGILVNYTQYCSYSYHNSSVFRVFWLLERLVTTNHGILVSYTHYCSDSYHNSSVFRVFFERLVTINHGILG